MTTTTITTSTVRFQLDAPGIRGLSLLDGEWRFTPSRRLVASDQIIAPATIVIKPTPADVAAGFFILDLPATDTGDYGSQAWAWVVREPRPGITRGVFVPTSTPLLEYASLPSIDPLTLDPLAEPEAAWTAALDQTNAQVQDALAEAGSANDAVGELAGQTLSRLGLKVDTATYNAFVALATAMFTTFTGELADLTTRVAALEAGIDGGLITATPTGVGATDNANGTAAVTGATDAGDGTASLTNASPGDGTLTI